MARGPDSCCADCRYWQPIGDNGECHRRAPAPHPFTDLDWPITAPDDWCGDFVREPQPVIAQTEQR